MERLQIDALSFRYPDAERYTIENITLDLCCGEFVTLCGATGSGKTTLLRLLKPQLYVQGERSGSIRCDDRDITAVPPEQIGFVMQDPEHQLVTDKVWHELAFGLENLGVAQQEIARRIAETAAFFGIETWFERRVSELSGGQKQLLNLAAVMVMDPDVLVLDEPTAQLDPIAATSFLEMLRRLNRELSVTVIIAEHRLEELIPMSDRLLVMEDGRLTIDAPPTKAVQLLPADSPLLSYLPAPVRLYHAVHGTGACPMTVREGRDYIRQHRAIPLPIQPSSRSPHPRPALTLKDLCYRYRRDDSDAVHELSLTVYEGEIAAVVGGNGAGKSTALLLCAGLVRPYRGAVKVFDRRVSDYPAEQLYHGTLALLTQDVTSLFLMSSVRDELKGYRDGERMLPFDLSPLYDRHPYDLSGGEQQLVALAKVLASSPRLLLLDEPTKGLDASAKNRLSVLLKKLRNDGVTVVLVTHDVAFAAGCADRTAMLFRGGCVSVAPTREFFSTNSFYTTAAARMARGLLPNAVTVEDIASQLSTEEVRA